jgi:hypothetical protein
MKYLRIFSPPIGGVGVPPVGGVGVPPVGGVGGAPVGGAPAPAAAPASASFGGFHGSSSSYPYGRKKRSTTERKKRGYESGGDYGSKGGYGNKGGYGGGYPKKKYGGGFQFVPFPVGKYYNL